MRKTYIVNLVVMGTKPGTNVVKLAPSMYAVYAEDDKEAIECAREIAAQNGETLYPNGSEGIIVFSDLAEYVKSLEERVA